MQTDKLIWKEFLDSFINNHQNNKKEAIQIFSNEKSIQKSMGRKL